jgi:hypothetical protein
MDPQRFAIDTAALVDLVDDELPSLSRLRHQSGVGERRRHSYIHCYGSFVAAAPDEQRSEGQRDSGPR